MAYSRKNGRGSNLERLQVPKDELLTRNAALPSLRDRIVYQAVVASFADRIDAQTSAAVHSARLNTSGDRFFLEKSTEAYGRFQRRTRMAVEDGYIHLAVADVAAYFDNIQHRLLFAQIQSLNPSLDALRLLGEMLNHWDLGSGAGIPQGPNASRVLGNLYLLPVDQAVQNLGLDVVYLRFQDDIRIVTRDRADAIKAMHVVEAELRKLALTPVAKKTRLIATKKEIDELLGDPAKQDIKYLMSLNLVDAPRKELRKMLDKALKNMEALKPADVRFSLWRLTQLRDSARVTKVLNRIDGLASFASLVSSFLLPFLHKPGTQRAVGAYLTDPKRNLFPFMSTWLLAALVESPHISVELERYARETALDRNNHRHLRAVAVLVIGRHGNEADRQWLESSSRAENDPFLVRAFITAPRHRGKVDRTLANQIVRRHPELKITTDYLNGRQALPSLIYPDRNIPVP